MNNAVHLDLDGAWDADILGLPRLDARQWAPHLRYHATRKGIEAFGLEFAGKLPPFVLYGSGDFHHLSATYLCAALNRIPGPVTLVSFDNHPDWDLRPPAWSCGGWINRALECPRVESAFVWGCGNFELAFPSCLFANRAALNTGRLEVHAWAERQTETTRRRFNCMTRLDWRERFADCALRMTGRSVYITVDLDCLRAEEAATNWENGLFTAADVAWAIRCLRAGAKIIGGDVCGAWSAPRYARWLQRLAGNWDHPATAARDAIQTKRINRASLETIWPVLVDA